jgi:AraC family transcriptional regulator
LAKIAVGCEAVPERRLLAQDDVWSVSDVICRAGPNHRPFEEQHSRTCVALVVQGSFQYQSSAGRDLMTPGSLLLGNAGQYFQCGHEHGVGDRCISFAYDFPYFQDLANEVGVCRAHFCSLRLPPLREFSQLASRACACLAESLQAALQNDCTPVVANHGPGSLPWYTDWEEISLELAPRALEVASQKPSWASSPAAESRVTRTVRLIESELDYNHTLGSLAREAKLSRYHFLRVFQQLTGLTPHRYILRARLRKAATRLMLEPARRVLDVALDSGFGDISNFNRSFHSEFGISPRSYRRTSRHGTRGK